MKIILNQITIKLIIVFLTFTSASFNTWAVERFKGEELSEGAPISLTVLTDYYLYNRYLVKNFYFKIPKGEYKLKLTLQINNIRYYILPIQQELNRDWSYRTVSKSISSYFAYRSYLLLDANTMKAHTEIMEKFNYPEKDDPMPQAKDWYSYSDIQPAEKMNTIPEFTYQVKKGSQVINIGNEVILKRAEKVATIKQENQKIAEAALQANIKAKQEKSVSSQMQKGIVEIGTKLCPMQSPPHNLVIFGWLEAVNPNKTKIQIRIPQYLPQPNGSVHSPYMHGLVWERSEDWLVCE